MSIFLIAEIKITDDAWVPAYAANVHSIVEKHGGKYLSRSGNIATLEGSQNNNSLIAIIQFPSKDALEGFIRSPEYQPYGKARQAGSISNLFTIDDTDVAGTISYLRAG
ncbi:MAG: hypothetical protein JWM78_3612 [Verrucomicrobiaceae bacterium]|nr:hypothetical protein [Verrucomicrobiaceae bacterium]